LGMPVLAPSPTAKTPEYFVSNVRGLTGTQLSSAMPLSSTTWGTRCLGTPRNRSKAISVSVNRVKHPHRGQQIKGLRLHGWPSNNHVLIQSFDHALKGSGLHAGGLASRLTH
jgi:hypothetical protein